MRITILTIGARGDVQPYVALGVGLKAAGHDVNFATHANFEELVTRQGLSFAPLPGNCQELFKKEEGVDFLESGQNNVRFVRKSITTMVYPILDELLPASYEACQGTEAIISMPLAVGSYHVAEKLGVPFCSARTCPATATRAFPSPYTPATLQRFGTYNWISYGLIEQLYWQSMRTSINRWRQKALDLPPIPLTARKKGTYLEKMPILYGFSPVVVPPPSDWPDCVHATGYWFLDHDPNWTPSAELINFLESGPPPLYISFGSLTGRNPEALTSLVFEALTRTGKRAVLDVGWGGLGDAKAPDNVFVAESSKAPHAWIFPRVSAVIHHGGQGTTAAALRAGVPSVTVPSFGELHFWGRRIAQLGAGADPIPKSKLSAERLAEAIQTVTSDRSIRDNAKAVGEKIRAEDGVARAVDLLNAYFSSARKVAASIS